jgi:hypothetical protein
LKTTISLPQVLHHTLDAGQTKGAATGENHCVHLFYKVFRTQCICAMRPWCAAADIHACNRTIFHHYHSAACLMLCICHLADAITFNSNISTESHHVLIIHD